MAEASTSESEVPPEFLPESCSESSESPSESCESPSQSSESGDESSATPSTSHYNPRKRKLRDRQKRYQEGRCRKAYKVQRELSESFEKSNITGVCDNCAPDLRQTVEAFKSLKHQGTGLKKRKNRLPHPKIPNRDHYRNLRVQNEWLRANVFDGMGNYIFCHSCLVKALRVSHQRLARQRRIKRNLFQRPLVSMKKSNVEKEKLMPFVVMPEGIDVNFKTWWSSIPIHSEVEVRYPHERHGLEGHTSNNAKTEEKESFLQFIDTNSQSNGRRLDSRNPTHYLLPKFLTITAPKRSDANYERKLASSLVGEFNRVQTESGKSTISNYSACVWLRDERPKVAIYPHKVDYCDFCAKVKKELQAIQQSINRLQQSGSATLQELKELEDDKQAKTSLLEEPLDTARESLKYYKEMKERCAQQWKRISEMEQLPSRSPEQEVELQQLKHTFTLVFSADYQMNKLMPYWGQSPQPGSTYYLQKFSYDVLGLVDHREENGHVYLFSELIGPKNTDHTFSYLMHYIKCVDKVPSWIKRVQIFLNNAGSTNKNQYLMASVYECVQQGILNYFRVSFMIAGHTKFAPDRLFALCAKSFYASDIFSEADFYYGKACKCHV